jgi:general secretion pathway protein H
MPTSVPGSSRAARNAAGFTLIELLVVLVLIAVSSAVVSLSLRDSSSSRLEEEGARLSALLEMARAEARASGVSVRWVPATAGDAPGLAADGNAQPAQFRFVGLPAKPGLPTRWLDPAVSAQVPGGAGVLLGPEAILPPQRIVLRLNDRQLELASDGLAPFAAVDGSAVPVPP